ncbi:MAG: hypothetical protein ABI723_07795 [Bacteroidia bacterium]
MKKFLLLVSLILFLNQSSLHAQGCSDAGFCTIGALQHQEQIDSSFKQKAKLSLSYGFGEQGTVIFQTIPEVEFSFLKNNSIQFKIPYSFINGNLGSVNGVGDIAFSITQTLKSTEKAKLNVTLGTKIATGHANSKLNSRSLPMPYQTSLGTYDFIAGASYQYKKWNISAGYQGVLSNKNENGFLRIYWEDNADAQKYFESNLLNRGDDGLLRVERNFSFKKIELSTGLLAIYRLQKDKITDETGNEIALKHSDGLTLNLTGSAQYDFSKRMGINLSFGTPLIVREYRADGLTRSLVITGAFIYHLGK